MNGPDAGASRGASRRVLPDEWVLPAVDEHNAEFFTSGELRLEHCPACGHVQHPPCGVCVACGQVGTDRVTVDPDGEVVSVVTVHHRLHPMLADAVPYDVAIVSLRAHPDVRIVGNIVGVEPGVVTIGTPVHGEWTAPLGDQGVRLLQWRPVPGARS